MIKIVASLLIVLLAALFQKPLLAHEFWIAPITKPLVAGDTARLSLLVGEQFKGDLVGFSKAQTANLRHFSSVGMKDLRALVPAVPVADLSVVLDAPGTHLIAFESHPQTISLPADSFHAYLHDEGLDFIRAQREASGQLKQPGRERYRRYVKTLLAVADAPGASALVAATQANTHAEQVGQRLELTPLSNPLAILPGDALGVRVSFEGKPLAGALIKAWHRHGDQSLIIRATTSADGVATVNLPYAGAWMVSVVHMVAVTGDKNVDWDSLWGNLSFVLPARR